MVDFIQSSSSFSCTIVDPLELLRYIQPLLHVCRTPTVLCRLLVSKSGLDLSTSTSFCYSLSHSPVDASLWLMSSYFTQFEYSSTSRFVDYTLDLRQFEQVLLNFSFYNIRFITLEKTENAAYLDFKNGGLSFHLSLLPFGLPRFVNCNLVVGSKARLPSAEVQRLQHVLLADFYNLDATVFGLVWHNGACEVVVSPYSAFTHAFSFKVMMVWPLPCVLLSAFDYLPFQAVSVGFLSEIRDSVLFELSLGAVGTLKVVRRNIVIL